MEIIYQIHCRWTEAQVEYFKKIGLVVPLGKFSMIEMDKELFTNHKEFIEQSKCMVAVGTNFTNGELKKADFVTVRGYLENGYPQPDGNFGYLNLTYNLDNYCEDCGAGLKQIAPLRMKKAPKLGSVKMFNLTWVYDEILVDKVFYESVFRKFGVACREVVMHGSDKPIGEIVQLDLPVSDKLVNMGEMSYTRCSKCQRKKFTPFINGYFPAYSSEKKMMFKTPENFGVEKMAYKRIIFSSELIWELLNQKQIKIINVVPCATTVR
jgi:hypothetical protein